jgi:hypothetical protein
MRRGWLLVLALLLVACQSLQQTEVDEFAEPWASAVDPGTSVLDGTPFVFDLYGKFPSLDGADVCKAVYGWVSPSERGYGGFSMRSPFRDGVSGIETSVTAGRYLSWTAPVDPGTTHTRAVVVSSKSGHCVYAYRWEGGTEETTRNEPPDYADAGLRAPLEKGGKVPSITQVSFCYWDDAVWTLERLIWGRQFMPFGGAVAVAVRQDGLVAVAGVAEGVFGEGNDDPGPQDAFVVILNPDGSTRKVWQIGTPNHDFIHELEFAPDGTLIAAGSTNDLLLPEFGGVHHGGFDAFVLKLDPDAGVLWIVQYGTAGDEYGNGMSIDPHTRHLYVVGDRRPSGGEHFVTHLSRFDLDGRLVWYRELATDGAHLYAADVAASGGAATVVGTTTGALAGKQHFGGHDPYIARYEANGDLAWLRQFGSAEDDGATSVAIDQSNRINVAGMTLGSVDPDREHLGGVDLFVVRYDEFGGAQWQHQFGTEADDFIVGIRRHLTMTGADGHAVVVASTHGDFAHEGAHAGGADVLVMRIGHTGDELQRLQYGSDGWDYGSAVVYGPDETLFIAGVAHNGYLVLSDDPPEGEEWCNAFVLKIRN